MNKNSAETPSMGASPRLVPRRRLGIPRLMASLSNSVRALRALARTEPAFRQELVALLVSAPAALMLAATPAHYFTLVGSVLAVLVVETINTAVEATCNALSSQYNDNIRLAKDCGSLAVLLTIIMSMIIWIHAIWYFIAT